MPNAADVGTLYDPNYHNIPWSQPGGPGTQVFPAQADGQEFSAYPVRGQIFIEAGSSLWRFGCGHGANVVQIFRDYDAVNEISVAIIACPICSFIQNLIEPFENAVSSVQMTVQHPIVIP